MNQTLYEFIVRDLKKKTKNTTLSLLHFKPSKGTTFSVRLTVKPQTGIGKPLTLRETVRQPFYFLRGSK